MERKRRIQDQGRLRTKKLRYQRKLENYRENEKSNEESIQRGYETYHIRRNVSESDSSNNTEGNYYNCLYF